MKRTTATITVLALSMFGLAACGRDSSTTTASQTGSAVNTGEVKGELSMWAMGAEGDKLPELVKDFESANPGVKVNVTAVPWDAAHDKFKAAIAGNATPDVAMVGTTWMGEFGPDALDPTPPSIESPSSPPEIVSASASPISTSPPMPPEIVSPPAPP